MLLSLCRMNDSQIIDECGLDAFCFLRILSMGMKISAIGAILALFLCPLYATANESEETAYITDGILKITITHVPASSSRLIATALAAYILFGSTMVLILEEFKIFTSHRHHYLKRLKPKNFSGMFVFARFACGISLSLNSLLLFSLHSKHPFAV